MSIDEKSTVLVFGGSGFLGRYLVQSIAKTGAGIVVVSRSSRVRKELLLCCAVGQIRFYKLPTTDEEMRNLFSNATHVINLIGIIREQKKETFMSVHVDLAEKIALFAKMAQCKRLVHVSALVCKHVNSRYGTSKISGEQAVLRAFPDAVIMRPSLIFGAEDKSLNLFIKMIRYLPVVPLIGGGKTKFQPIYVGDVAEAIIKSLSLDLKLVQGKILELAGEHQYSMKQLFRYLATALQKKRILFPTPLVVFTVLTFFLERFSFFPLTLDQLRSLKKDSILHSANGMHYLGIKPKNMHHTVISYIL